MPGERHVFDSLFAGVTNQRESQTVFDRAAKLICARAFAAFRSFAARLLDCDSVTGDCVGSPDAALRINDVERTVGLHRPDGSDRVGPRADQRPWRSGRSSRASIHEQEKNTSESNSESGLYFHVFSLSAGQRKVKLRSRRRQFAKSF